MSREAMKLALEEMKVGNYNSAAERLETALAEQPAQKALDKMAENARELGLDYEPAQQEPVATLWQHGRTGRTRITMPGDITDCDANWFKASDLYTSPPAQRPWVGLTSEELDEMFRKTLKGKKLVNWVARAIEAKLREKNNG